MYEVHIRHKEFDQKELAERGGQIREQFFQKPKPCLRASMLPKKYGWGIHFNNEGKLALFPMESPEYRRFVDGQHEEVRLLAAMRNSKKK